MYRRHATDVYRYALMVLRSAPDAEDVTQATFVRAHRALASGERVRKPRHWLLKIGHRECLRHLQSAAPVPRWRRCSFARGTPLFSRRKCPQ